MPPPDRVNAADFSDEILAILRCPDCSGLLAMQPEAFSCKVCLRDFPKIGSLYRFVEAENYASSFGFEWGKYARTQLDTDRSHESETTFREKTGFTPEQLAGKLVLDVGCGMGRFAQVAGGWGAKVVAVDLSRSVEQAAENLADKPNIWVAQADLFRLPFATGSFDYVYSLGVLQHTPNAEAAFKALPGFLKPGGMIAIAVYSGYNKWYRMSELYRRITIRMPLGLLHALCHVAVPLYYVHRVLKVIPLVGSALSAGLKYLLPVSLHPVKEWRILDTFNWYSPPYQSKHTYEEVFRWFEDCGLRDLRVLHNTISVQGRRPAPIEQPLVSSSSVSLGRAQT